jgi:hypothetical protein
MSRIAKQVIFQAGLTGLVALSASLVASNGLDDLQARAVLCTGFALWAAVGSGISAFVLLSMEASESPRGRR